MRLLSCMLLFSAVTFLPGCGSSSPEEGDSSDLATPAAQQSAEEARAKYLNPGKEGPKE